LNWGNGELVVLSDEEIQNASPEKSKAIDILEFVDEAQIPSLYFERPYYAVPDKSAVKAYAVLREALARTTKVGIGQLVLRNREYLCALKAQGSVLVLNALRFANEVLSTTDLPIPHLPNPGEKEVAMAVRLIEEMSGDFKPEKYKDTFTEDLKRLIGAKASGKTVRRVPKAVRSTKVVDLMSLSYERALTNRQVLRKGQNREQPSRAAFGFPVHTTTWVISRDRLVSAQLGPKDFSVDLLRSISYRGKLMIVC
jgi:DNA end-binding protein Ku